MVISGDGDGRMPAHGDGTPKAHEAAERLRQHLSALARGRGSRLELHDAAAALVSELRREEQAPEQVLLRIKEILGEAGLRPSYATSDITPVGPDMSVYQDVIALCIRVYYDGDGPGR